MMWMIRYIKKQKADTESSYDEALEATGNLIKAWPLIPAQHHTALGNGSKGKRAKNPLSASDRIWCYSYNLPKEYTQPLFHVGLRQKAGGLLSYALKSWVFQDRLRITTSKKTSLSL